MRKEERRIRRPWIWSILLAGLISLASRGFICAAPLSDDPNPFLCEANSGVKSGIWTTTGAVTFSWTAVGANGTLVYFGTDNAGTSADLQLKTDYGPITPAASGRYYLRLADYDSPATWYTCFTYAYDVTPPDIEGAYGSELGDAQDNVWQHTVTDPVFTISNLYDPESGLSGYYRYFGSEAEGTSSDYFITSDFSYDPGPLTDGIYYLRVQAVDNLNNTSAWKTLFVFKLDTDPPADVVYPAQETHTIPESTWQGLSSPSPNFTWAPAAGASRYLVYWGTNSTGTATDSVSSPAYSPSNPASSGVYFLRVLSVDEAGNTGSTWVTLFTYWFDGTPPTIVSQILETNYGLTSGVCTDKKNPIFTWDAASDGDSGLVGYEYYWGSDSAGISPVTRVSQPPLSLHVSPGDKFYFRLAAVDQAGNLSDWVTGFILCNGDVVNTISAASGGATDMEVPYENIRALFEFPANAYQVDEGGKWVGKDFYSRIWYPSGHRDPTAGMAAPNGHESFDLALDSAEGCADIPELNQEMTVTLTYSEGSVLALKEDTLQIYRWNGNEWKPLNNRTIDTEDNVVTGTTPKTGEFLLMGEPIPVEDQLSITAGALSFGSHPLTGRDLDISGTTDPWVILDATYSDQGWYVTIRGDDFSDGLNHSIPITNLQLRIPEDHIFIQVGSASPGTLVTDWAQMSTDSMAILASQVGAGTGRFSITPEFLLKIPAEAYGGTYTSHLYLTIISGPTP